jgi:hypothetical protein
VTLIARNPQANHSMDPLTTHLLYWAAGLTLLGLLAGFVVFCDRV